VFAPFVGRHTELARLRDLHAQRKHVLILGSAGVGKSALVAQLHAQLSLLTSVNSGHFGSMCEGLEPQLGLDPAGLRLLQRKQRLRQALADSGRTVVFDGVGWVSPKVSSFLEGVGERVPVWVCARSERPWDIGHLWPLLVRFERVELRPFHPTETRAVVQSAVAAGSLPSAALGIAEWLHRRSAGIPRVLCQLCGELATGRYDLGHPQALRRLELDRRIHEVLPGAAFGPAAAGREGRERS
jgi:hypothetical protein